MIEVSVLEFTVDVKISSPSGAYCFEQFTVNAVSRYAAESLAEKVMNERDDVWEYAIIGIQ